METEEARLVSRCEAAAYLNSLGYPIATATLAKMAVTGGGPPYTKFGRRALYDRDVCKAWAESKCRWRRSTSDSGVSVGLGGKSCCATGKWGSR